MADVEDQTRARFQETADALVVGEWSHTARQLARHGIVTAYMKKVQGEWLMATDHASTSE